MRGDFWPRPRLFRISHSLICGAYNALCGSVSLAVSFRPSALSLIGLHQERIIGTDRRRKLIILSGVRGLVDDRGVQRVWIIFPSGQTAAERVLGACGVRPNLDAD
jgi:hypothetical protein